MASVRIGATATTPTATLCLVAAAWVVALQQMNGMDMGVASGLGSFSFFLTVGVLMMAAMMLPGAVPAVVRHARAFGGVRAVPLFRGSYLAVWTLVGIAAYVAFGLLIMVDPSSVPGLTPPM